jgi:hypothetical protein
MGDCFATLAMTYGAMLPNDFAFALWRAFASPEHVCYTASQKSCDGDCFAALAMTFDAWGCPCEERRDAAISSGIAFVRVIDGELWLSFVV